MITHQPNRHADTPQPQSRTTPLAAGALVAVTGLAASGCARQPAADRSPGPVRVAQPAAAPALAPADDQSCHPLESFRPQGALPRPGQMPHGSTMAAIVRRGRLIAGVDQNSYLFGYRDPLSGQLDGLERRNVSV